MEDSLKIGHKFSDNIKNLSKRKILAVTQGIFDLIGFLAPALLPAKMIIQEAWSTKLDWDAKLPEELRNNFQKWYNELKYLNEVKIDRHDGYGCKENWSIHTFCDASTRAFATAVFFAM